MRAGNDVTLFHHHLVRNAGARRIKIDAVLVRERFDLRVLRQILRRSVLDVVIDREDRLRRIRDRGCADLLELSESPRPCCHASSHGADESRRNLRLRTTVPARQSIRVPRRNFLNKRQTHIVLVTTNPLKLGLKIRVNSRLP